jgi:ferric-dicitrate binding protein FerR (iron transport regulator)
MMSTEEFGPIEQAVAWALRHEEGESAADLRFRRWLKTSPDNPSLYAQAVAVSERLKGLDPERKIDLADLLARASTDEDVASEGSRE